MKTTSNNIATNYYLKFDKKTLRGTPEHYWHFMWGYLLPALNEIINIEQDINSKNVSKTFLFRSCGPVMNNLINEMLLLYNCNYKILEKDVLDTGNHFATIMIPRWDVWLMNMALRQNIESPKIKDFEFIWKHLKISFKSRSLKKFFLLSKKHFVIKKNAPKADFLSSILNVKKNTIHKIHNLFPDSGINLAPDNYLLLKRSLQPKYYEKGGEEEGPTYGTGRRELMGIEDAAKKLRSKDISVKVFEPGKHTLVEHIITFQNCKGIVGIRGAEFANLIWMKQKSKVIFIDPLTINNPPLQKPLAKLLRLNYFEIKTNEGSHPTLNAELISKYLMI